MIDIHLYFGRRNNNNNSKEYNTEGPTPIPTDISFNFAISNGDKAISKNKNNGPKKRTILLDISTISLMENFAVDIT